MNKQIMVHLYYEILMIKNKWVIKSQKYMEES